MIVCFVDTGGIIYHHCVNFLFNVNMILMNDLHLFVIFLNGTGLAFIKRLA